MADTWEWGIDPANWNVGVNFGQDYHLMLTVGPLYLIIWDEKNHR